MPVSTAKPAALLPEWLKPENASVMDPAYRAPLRAIVKWLGLDDPNQIMAFGTPIETGPMAGGALDAVAARFPRFAAAIKAFHGSPHDFEKFDASKIGTGEGAQAYGHGLYFAENENTARVYRDALGGDGMKFADGGSQMFDRETPEGTASFLLNAMSASDGDLAATYKAARRDLYEEIGRGLGKNNGRYERNLEALKVLDKWEQSGAKPGPVGKMYEVGINAHPDQFLDWDKPLSEQSEHVQKALTAVGGSPGDIRGAIDVYRSRLGMGGRRAEIAQEEIAKLERELAAAEQMTGEQFYRRAHDVPGEYPSRDTASRRLNEAGIPGIKYLDQGSRGPAVKYDVGAPRADFGPYSPYVNRADAERQLDLLRQHGFHDAEIKVTTQPQTRNFVVFDAKTVDILRKYGILAPLMGGAGAAAASQQQGAQQ